MKYVPPCLLSCLVVIQFQVSEPHTFYSVSLLRLSAEELFFLFEALLDYVKGLTDGFRVIPYPLLLCVSLA